MTDQTNRYQSNPSQGKERLISEQFYDWERRGRGWRVFNFPVDLEPPFQPFIPDIPPEPRFIDDGRKPTIFSSFLEKLRSEDAGNSRVISQTVVRTDTAGEAVNAYECSYYDEQFIELQIILPREFRMSKAQADQMLLSLSYCSDPVSFEVIGTSSEIIIQIATTERDLSRVEQQLKAHLPGAVITRSANNTLEGIWRPGDERSSLVADFGLSNEFFLPLAGVKNADSDLLITIIGALSDFRPEETGIFQVLFQKTQNDWGQEVRDILMLFDGTPFFQASPEIPLLAKQKISSPFFSVIIRAGAKAQVYKRELEIVRSIGAGLSLFANPSGNEFIPLSNDEYPPLYHETALLHRQSFRCGMLLNLEELSSIVHPPSPYVQSEKLIRETEKTKLVPQIACGHQLVLGQNHHQNEVREVTLSDEQRTRHIHLIGASGSGKSTLMLSLIRQDFENGHGLCVIDPHGDLIDEVLQNVPEGRIDDVVLFDPSDSEYPVGFNILQANSELEKTILSSDLTATFRRMSTSWGDVMDSVLANAVLAFVESSRGGTLFELKRFLVEKAFRDEFLKSVSDEAIRYFWQHEFPLIAGKPQASILVRLDTFLRQRLVRNIVCQKETKIDFRGIMDNRKILLIKLSQGMIGEENAYLLGTLLVSKLYQTALTRQDTRERPYFWLYMDEFHHFITPSMEGILSGTRKYHLGLTLAHQEFRQLQSRNQEVASSVLSNCYTRLCFRLGDNDAEKLAGGFSFFDAKALQNLGIGEAIGRIERAEYDFNLKTTPVPHVDNAIAERTRLAVVDLARMRYAKPRLEVEASVLRVTEIKTDADESAIPARKKDAVERTAKKTVGEPDGDGQHRYLQSLVKRIGERSSFIVTLEKEVFGGIGKIDATLESESYKVACEIAVTNSVEYEIKNMQKCLAAGFDKVVVISPDTKHLGQIKKKAEEVLPGHLFQQIHFLEPDHFHLFLQNLDRPPTGGEPDLVRKVKGYRVNVSYKSLEQKQNNLVVREISDIVEKAIKRKETDE